MKRNFGGATKPGEKGSINAARKALKADEEVLERTGEYYIRFTPIRGRHEAMYETTDPVVASYIRDRLPEFPQLYEEVGPMLVEVNGEMIEVLPANDHARQTMAAAAAIAGHFVDVRTFA